MKSRFDRPHENKNDCVDSSVLLFSRGSLFRRRPAHGHLEVERSQIEDHPGTLRYNTVTVENMFGNVKVTADGLEGDGKPVHNEWTGNFDGKDYSVTGDPIADTRSYTKVDDRTLNFTIKKGEKIVDAGRLVVSLDGKSRTVTIGGTTPKGKKFCIASRMQSRIRSEYAKPRSPACFSS